VIRLTEDAALDLVQRCMTGAGLSESDASMVAGHLVDASLRGFPRFGLARTLELVDSVARRSATPARVVHETATSAVLDGGDTIGYVVAHQAADLAATKASRAGVAVVGAHNTYFTGLLAYYCERAAARGLVSIASSSGEALVAPFAARTPLVGTNPFAIGVPATPDPVIWDIGTSAVMRGDVWMRARTGEPLDSGVAIDSSGSPTTDPAAALDGALLAWGGHRGSGLAIMVQLLGMLAGASAVPARGVGSSNGFLFMAVDPAALCGRAQLADAVTAFREFASSAPTSDDEPLRLPYERSLRERAFRREAGIPVGDELYQRLRELAEKGVTTDAP
jgi:LDH2 family malate/lactate/ureidoglycolate dehydrogenase